MCQEAVRRLINPSEGCHVRKVARLLAQALNVAGAIIVHSLSSSRDVSVEDHPRAVYCQGLYFVDLARTLFPIHHPLVFPKKLPRIPEEDPPQEGRMEGLHLSVRLALEDRHAQCP